MIDGNLEQELAAAHSAVEKLARAGDIPAVVTSALGDLVRLIDALANGTKDDLYRLGSELSVLKANAQRLQLKVDLLEEAASAARTESQSLQVEMRGLDRFEKKLDQSVSRIADRVTALEARP